MPSPRDKYRYVRTRAVLLLLIAWICVLSPAQAKPKAKTNNATSIDNAFAGGFEKESELEQLNSQMQQLFSEGKYDESLDVARKACTLATETFGPKHEQTARSINNLAWHEQSVGDYVGARRHFEQALLLQQQLYGKGKPELATVTNNLGNLLAFQGDYDSAIPLLMQAHELEIRLLGKSNPLLVPSMINLANVLASAGKADDGMELLKQSQTIYENPRTTKDIDYARCLSTLAAFEQRRGEAASAEKHLQESLHIQQSKLGNEHPDLCDSLINLGVVQSSSGHQGQALANLNQARKITVDTHGAAHINLVPVLNNLGLVQLAGGNTNEARTCFQQSAEIVDNHIKNVLPSLSFGEQRVFIGATLPAAVSGLISTCDETQAKKCYNYLLPWKGLLVESLRRQNKIERLSDDPEIGPTVKKLGDTRRRFAQLFHRSGALPLSVWNSKTADLIAQKETLERQLAGSKVAATVQDVLADVDISAFQKLLKPDEVLVDIYKFGKHSANGKQQNLAAFVVSSEKVSLVDLGPDPAIKAAVATWRAAATERHDCVSEWQDLTRLVWAKIAAELPAGKTKIIVCPDSELSLIPINSFATPGQMITQMNSPRELVSLRRSDKQSAPETQPQFILTGGLEFGKSHGEGDLSVPALPGTVKEAKQVEQIAQAKGFKTTLLSGTEVTRKRLSTALESADMAHLATHGFFQSSGFALAMYKENLGVTPLENSQLARDPLASSGLILSAASPEGSPEILTAEEMVTLDLKRCRLLTLSACETGLGKTEPGQGVMGLRASLMAAGARSILMSLWKVPDEPTVIVMQEFYKGILEKNLPAAEALARAQQIVREKSVELKKPYHWDAWVLVGEAW